MKKYHFFISIFIGLFIVSCRDEIYEEIIDNIGSTQILLTPEEYTSIAYDNPRELSQSEIFNIVDEFQNLNSEVNNAAITRSSDVFNMMVINKYYIKSGLKSTIEFSTTRNRNSSETDVPIFEVELSRANNNRDYVVVCGDERAAKVFFYVNDYCPCDEMNLETKYLFELSKKSILLEIELVEKIKCEKRDSTLNKISKELRIPKEQVSYEKIKKYIVTTDAVNTRSVLNPPGGVDKPMRIISFVNPMTKITWSQDYPYNNQFPIGPVFSGGKRYDMTNYSVGCANVATATLFSVIRPAMVAYSSSGETLVDWDYVTSMKNIYIDEDPTYSSPPRLVSMVTGLLLKIYEGTKSYPLYKEMEVYDENINLVRKNVIISTETKSGDMLDYIRKAATFSGDKNTVFNAESARQSLFAKKPVLLFGNGYYVDDSFQIAEGYKNQRPGHAFLIDGYFMTRRSGQVGDDHYWSVNMGWGNSMSKGYFKTQDNFQDCDIIFGWGGVYLLYYTQEQNMIYNIARSY